MRLRARFAAELSECLRSAPEDYGHWYFVPSFLRLSLAEKYYAVERKFDLRQGAQKAECSKQFLKKSSCHSPPFMRSRWRSSISESLFCEELNTPPLSRGPPGIKISRMSAKERGFFTFLCSSE